jgi:RNA polymerase sigma-70 factor (ECF subfamily)
MNAKEYNITVENHADAIYRFVLKHLRNEMSSQDVVQETFMKVWTKHEEISAEKAKSYLFTTAYNTMLDWINKEKRNGDFEKVLHHPLADEKPNFDVQGILNEALNRLPEIQKTVILLRDYEGYNYAEIAEITKLNESQVKVYIFRGRQTLKTYLKDRELVA